MTLNKFLDPGFSIGRMVMLTERIGTATTTPIPGLRRTLPPHNTRVEVKSDDKFQGPFLSLIAVKITIKPAVIYVTASGLDKLTWAADPDPFLTRPEKDPGCQRIINKSTWFNILGRIFDQEA